MPDETFDSAADEAADEELTEQAADEAASDEGEDEVPAPLTAQEELDAFRAAGVPDAMLDVRTDASGGVISVSRIGVESH